MALNVFFQPKPNHASEGGWSWISFFSCNTNTTYGQNRGDVWYTAFNRLKGGKLYTPWMNNPFRVYTCKEEALNDLASALNTTV